MSEPAAPVTVVVERLLAAPRDVVFDAWTDGATLAAFICPDGVAEVSIDPRVGGSIRIEMIYRDRRHAIEGEYLALDRPDRVSFTWRSANHHVDSVVHVTFADRGHGATLMTIVHSLLPPDIAGRFDAG